MQPLLRELEPLLLQDPLPLSVHVHLLLPAPHLPLEALHVGDEADSVTGGRGVNGLLLQVLAGLADRSVEGAELVTQQGSEFAKSVLVP